MDKKEMRMQEMYNNICCFSEVIAKVYLLRLLRRYAPRNDRKDAICHCERSAAIPFLNSFAITSARIFLLQEHPYDL